MKVSELLDSPEKWTQNAYARNSGGKTVGYREKDARCWCLVGALKKCYSGTDLQIAIQKLGFVSETNVVKFNDASGATFDDVRELVLDAGV